MLFDIIILKILVKINITTDIFFRRDFFESELLSITRSNTMHNNL